MARKNGTLDDQRVDIKKKYKLGARADRRIVAFDTLTEIEQATKREAACFLKAADFSHSYIAEALNTTRSVVKGWFVNEPAMRERVGEIQMDYIDGAVKLLKTYAIELVEMLVEIARDGTVDAKTRVSAITEALDRIGMSKVNKSESAAVVSTRTEVDLTDKHGVLSQLKDASPEKQQEVAAKLQEAFDLAGFETDDEEVANAQS